MKNIFKVIVIILVIGIVVLQFFRPERVNPPIARAETLEAVLEVPADVSAILERSCNDCHSNKTDFPWYSNISPLSWQVVDHIRVGREEMNFSKWGTYSAKRQKHKLEEICEQIEADEMPHNQYLWIHWDAALSAGQKKILCDWTEKEKAKFADSGEKNS